MTTVTPQYKFGDKVITHFGYDDNVEMTILHKDGDNYVCGQDDKSAQLVWRHADELRPAKQDSTKGTHLMTTIKLNATSRRIKELLGDKWFTMGDARLNGVKPQEIEALNECGLLESGRKFRGTVVYRLATKFKSGDKVGTLFGDDFAEMEVLYFDGVSYRCRYEDEQGQTDVWRYPDEIFEVDGCKLPAEPDSITALRKFFATMQANTPIVTDEDTDNSNGAVYEFHWQAKPSPARPRYSGVQTIDTIESGENDMEYLQRLAIKTIARKMELHMSEIKITRIDSSK